MATSSRAEPAAGARVFTAGQRWALLGVVALLAMGRVPVAWVRGRFLDEEATVFLAYAWHRPWTDALLRPFGGYWNAAANAVTLALARAVQGGVVPLERAPWVTMTAGLLAQLVPAALLLFGRAAWLADRRAVVAALLLLVCAPASEEVFANAMHIQFHLALAAALVLALDTPRSRAGRAAYLLLLLAAPLCGPGAIVIAPLFAVRAAVDRDRERALQFAAFAGGAAVQLLGFYGHSPLRGHPQGWPTLAATLLVRLVALPLGNLGVANRLGLAVYLSQRTGGLAWWIAAAIGAGLLGGLLAVAARRRDAAVWLVTAGLGVAAASFGFGMIVNHRLDLFSADMGERYNYLPVVLLGWALIVLAQRPGAARAWATLVALVLLHGAIRYPVPAPAYADGPSWAGEVAQWQRDHRHPLAVWPAPWTAHLSDRAPACPRPDRATASAPRYCEAGWLAGIYRQRRAVEAGSTVPLDEVR